MLICLFYNMKTMDKTIKISNEMYDAIQMLKKNFSEMSWTQIDSDEDVLGILISTFLDAVNWEHHHWDWECCWWEHNNKPKKKSKIIV